MLLSTSIGYYLPKIETDKIIEITSKAGFDALDFAFFNPKYFDEETDSKIFEENFKTLRKKVEDKNMIFNQAHAPYPTSTGDINEEKLIFKKLTRSMRNASYLGIDKIVVHPCHHLSYSSYENREKLFEINMEFYNSLKPYCEEYNIKIALENMWGRTGNMKINHSTCSTPGEFIRYVDSLDNEWFTACLDIGHTMLVCEDAADFIRKLGNKRLTVLHVHDVDGITDTHTIPYGGICNWEEITKALKEIDYKGDFTFEPDNYIRPLPDELLESATIHLANTGRYLMSKIMC